MDGGFPFGLATSSPSASSRQLGCVPTKPCIPSASSFTEFGVPSQDCALSHSYRRHVRLQKLTPTEGTNCHATTPTELQQPTVPCNSPHAYLAIATANGLLSNNRPLASSLHDGSRLPRGHTSGSRFYYRMSTKPFWLITALSWVGVLRLTPHYTTIKTAWPQSCVRMALFRHVVAPRTVINAEPYTALNG
ncbi:hypothetical protein BU25DRAFT_71403 [Macroventuria anomochaeta]|uniref:Uncharacterized protein n=1 Tax=Macroventuria anomochaeta TaxID=301207 RepID=A0ACB6S265_9PLEO|nr:uncharacterized protein BU25DRAFT_71403 [Macroventuria anomochaeta]KAF2627232.1 hypothetical protein BU25DRAFT_71403 [Macroventuria anomochaeta]